MIDLKPHEPLIKLLSDQFKTELPKPSMDINTIMFNAGQQYVIEWLYQKMHSQQTEEIMTNVPISSSNSGDSLP